MNQRIPRPHFLAVVFLSLPLYKYLIFQPIAKTKDYGGFEFYEGGFSFGHIFLEDIVSVED